MRIDPHGMIGGHPAPVVRQLIRRLSALMFWNEADVRKAAAVSSREAGALITVLQRQRLVKRNRGENRSTWRVTQLGQTFGSATMAKPITRRTAERALSELLERVRQANGNDHFLAKVTKVVLFGSFLREGVERLGDVDVAVQLEPKQQDGERARMLNEKRVAEVERKGHRFGGFLEREFYWHRETFRFLKGRSRSIALVDYKAEKAFVDQVPHRFLLGESDPAPAPLAKRGRSRRPKDCPF
jgi:predicted nucleotidyltransferase